MLTSAEIRKKFLDYFQSKGHTIVPSAPIVVKNDPTLLFTNAGMNPFKDYFLGNSKAPYSRVADTQKCLRVSGKHNDLEEVGVDTYHHTMFEMLGNWSFGDPARPSEGYFKKEAIAWSWELLTSVYGISKDRLYVTVFEGDGSEKIPRDDEAMVEWEKWIDADRIVMGNKKDNFWEMGDTGPCGPCTEIHVDCRPDAERARQNGRELVNKDHPQVIEIWNNVFIQFNRLKDGGLEPLPARHVDTGMGLERLARVIQGKSSNYDTDIFQPYIKHLEKDFNRPYGNNERTNIAMRVIADHIRAVSFAIADGQLPSNTGAGYVIRRILRRAIRYGYSFLDAKIPFIYELVDVLDMNMGDVFPEIRQQKEFIKKVIKEEELGFFKTLADGMWKIQYFFQYAFHDSFPISKVESYAAHDKKIIPGRLAFNLYDTDGFPLDLTKLVAFENGFSVDDEGFGVEMKQQKDRSRVAAATDTEDWTILIEHPLAEFVGYDTLEINSKIAKYRKVKSKGKEAWQIVLEANPFYAESGGQIGDTGVLQSGQETIHVTDTKKENNLVIHFTEKLPSELKREVLAKVDITKRKQIEAHHSATHLLHAALRKVLGTHVTQKGSLVNAEQLRFDFSHFAKLTDKELTAVGTLVNEKIRENIPVIIKEMHKDKAINMGAMALFGEKYGDIVRVVIIDPDYSVELCGGTHVSRTGDLGFFIITQETAVASGVRRIEAKASKPAFEHLYEELLDPLENAERITKKKPKEIPVAIENLLDENSYLKKKLEGLENKNIKELASFLSAKVSNINGLNFIGEVVDLEGVEQLKKLAFELKNKIKNHVFALGCIYNNTPYFLLLVDNKFYDNEIIKPAEILKSVSGYFDGKGGGKALVVSSGTKPDGLIKAIIEVEDIVRNLVENNIEIRKKFEEFLNRN